ncbi:MAG: response regulator transcription factor [Actinomycetota bacterium]|nr:response regulator transcription factor [Actinomycetota bacterium]
MKILIIEDEKLVADNIKTGLEQHKFTVDVAYNGLEGLNLAQDYDYDIIILDLMLPDIPGEELCLKIRKEKINSFILMLTAKKQIENIVEGLNCGADDYLTKPFEFTELLARLRALLRRTSKDKENILTAFEIKIDMGSEQVFSGEKEVKLTKKEFMVLEYLLRHRGQVVSRNQILEHAWDRNVDIFTNIVDTHIKNIRKKLGNSGKHIETIYGSGYRIQNEDIQDNR